MGPSDSEYSSNVLVRNLKSCEEVVKKRGAKKKTGGAKKKTRGLAKSAPRKSRIARYDRVNEEDDDDGMDNIPGMDNDEVEEENARDNDDDFVAVRRHIWAKKPWSITTVCSSSRMLQD
jgi:hypothetical protein